MPLTPYIIAGPIQQTPDPSQTQSQLRYELDPNTGVSRIRATTDGGQTFRTIAADISPGTPIGSVLTVGSDRNAAWSKPATVTTAATTSIASYAGNSFFAELCQFGSIYAGQTFGFFQVPANTGLVCAGFQLSLQSAAVGSSATVCAVTADTNVETTQNASLGSGLEFGQFLFQTPLVLPAGSTWRNRVKAVGTTTAGECLSVRWILSLPS